MDIIPEWECGTHPDKDRSNSCSGASRPSAGAFSHEHAPDADRSGSAEPERSGCGLLGPGNSGNRMLRSGYGYLDQSLISNVTKLPRNWTPPHRPPPPVPWKTNGSRKSVRQRYARRALSRAGSTTISSIRAIRTSPKSRQRGHACFGSINESDNSIGKTRLPTVARAPKN